MDFFDIVSSRYSVKLFTGETIPEEKFDKILDAIILSPSSFNIQPWKIKIIKDKNILKKLQIASYDQPQIGSASHLLVFCSIKDLVPNKNLLLKHAKEKISKEKFKGYKEMLDNYFIKLSPKRLEELSKREVYLAVENALLASTALGYGACPVGGFSAKEYKNILKIPKGLTPIVVVPIGIPKDIPRKKFRLGKEEIFF